MHRRLLVALVALFSPAAAWAFGCVSGAPQGFLFDTAGCRVTGIFSGLMCNVESLLSTILSAIYCGVQATLMGPLEVAITVYIMVFGIQFMLGYVEAPLAEGLQRIIKIGLVWIFATNSAWGIGIAYTFFFSAMQTGIGWMLKLVTNTGMNNTGSAFAYMDQLVANILSGPLTMQGAALGGLIASLSWFLPPIGFLFAYFTGTSLMVLIRALLAYLLGISVIAFLMTMSPLFFSLALFKATRQFFEDWLRYMVSLSLQVVLVFGGLALWFLVVGGLANTFFTALASMIVPVKMIATVGAVRVLVDDWGICYPGLACPIMPSQLVEQGQFIWFLMTNLIALCITVYCFNELMKQMPNLARQLAGPAYAPMLGGDASGMGSARQLMPSGSVNFPGMSQLTDAGNRARDGFFGQRGGLVPAARNFFGVGNSHAEEDGELQMSQLRNGAQNLIQEAEAKLITADAATRGKLQPQIDALREAARSSNREVLIQTMENVNRSLASLR